MQLMVVGECLSYLGDVFLRCQTTFQLSALSPLYCHGARGLPKVCLYCLGASVALLPNGQKALQAISTEALQTVRARGEQEAGFSSG